MQQLASMKREHQDLKICQEKRKEKIMDSGEILSVLL